MGATAKLGLPWPELANQADGPAAFQALAQATENKMTNLVSKSDWNADVNIQVVKNTQVTVFSQDVAAAAIGWAWLDVSFGIAVVGSEGGRFPSQVVQNTGGSLLLAQGATTLRTLRWHSRGRSEFFYISGGVAIAVPSETSVIQVRVVMTTDSTSSSDGWLYEYSVGLTQLGAARS